MKILAFNLIVNYLCIEQNYYDKIRRVKKAFEKRKCLSER